MLKNLNSISFFTVLILTSCTSVPSKLNKSMKIEGFGIIYNEDQRTVEIVSFPVGAENVTLGMSPCYQSVNYGPDNGRENVYYSMDLKGVYNRQTLRALYGQPINIRYRKDKDRELSCFNTGIFFKED